MQARDGYGPLRWTTLLTVGLGSLALFWIGFVADSLPIRLATKALPALALAGWALGREPRTGRPIALGLALGSIGDVVLEAGFFLPGLVSFLLGHLAYIVAFVRETPRRAPGLAVLPALFVGVLLTMLWDRLGPMRLPVVVYAATIGAMIWRASARLEARADRFGALGLVGAIVFALSDGMIAVNKFYEPFTGARVAILVTYWLAQSLIAAGLAPRDDSNVPA